MKTVPKKKNMRKRRAIFESMQLKYFVREIKSTTTKTLHESFYLFQTNGVCMQITKS